MKLEGYIAHLLKNHNCVIVPDFGGFVANYKSAVIDEHRKKIFPPSKSVLFNPHLTNNDGLLGNYVSQKENLSYPDALSLINESISGWRKGFEAGERIEIGELGFLYLQNGTVHFEQSREMNLLLQAFGLRSINFVKFNKESLPVEKAQPKVIEPVIAKEEVQKVEEKIEAVPVQQEEKPVKIIELVDETVEKKVKEKPNKIKLKKKDTSVIALDKKTKVKPVKNRKKADRTEVISINRNRTKTVLRYAAAVVFVPILFYSYWIPMETDALETSSIQLKDFNPVHKQSEKKYSSRDAENIFEEIKQAQTWNELTENINASIYNFELTEDFYVPVMLTTEVLTDNSSHEVIHETNGSFHVIAGCFSVKSNAENLVKDLNSQGFSALILDKSGGLTRVSAGGYTSKDDAKTGLKKLRDSGQSGWILKK